MIDESIYWRRDLYRSAKELRRKSRQLQWREGSLSIAENRLIVGAFSIRRLIDSLKLPGDYGKRPLQAVELKTLPYDQSRYRYSLPIDILIATEMYDFSDGRNITMRLGEFLNQLIHSHILLWATPPMGISPEAFVLVTSDYDKDRRIFAIWLNEVATHYEHASLLDQKGIQRRWSESTSSWSTIIEGEISERLSDWGFVSREEMAELLARQASKQKPARKLRSVLKEFDALVKEEVGVEI